MRGSDVAVLVLQQKVRVPCSTPGAAPPAKRAACRPRAIASPPASTPISRHAGRRGTRRRCRWRCCRRRRRRRATSGSAPVWLEDLRRAPRGRSPTGTRAPSADTDAARAPSRAGSTCVRTLVTQSRIASLIASFSVRLPRVDAAHLGAEQAHAEHVERLPLHVLGAHVDDALEAEQRAAVAVATPCWPAPVSATMRVLPMRTASSAWPSALLILCAPVWQRSSRLRKTRAPQPLARAGAASESGVGRPT